MLEIITKQRKSIVNKFIRNNEYNKLILNFIVTPTDNTTKC